MNNEDALILAQYLKIEKLRKRLRRNFSKLQHQVIDDPANIVAWVAARRSSKTFTAARKLVDVALCTPSSYVLYLSTSRKQSKKLMWRPLKEILRKLKIQAEISEVELTMTLQNQSTIWCSGVPDEASADAYRGLPYALCVIDECASLGNYIDYLEGEVLGPALMETGGQLWLVGTPSDVLTGRFYELTKDAKLNGNVRKVEDSVTVSTYHSDITQNPNFPPFIKMGINTDDPVEIMLAARKIWAAECIKNRWTAISPECRRELYGHWTADAGSNPYVLQEKNFYTVPPDVTKLNKVLGIDLGFRDHASFVVVGYDIHADRVYELFAWEATGLTATEIKLKSDEIANLYHPEIVVIDSATGGLSHVAEMAARTDLQAVAAEKQHKAVYMRQLSDDMKEGKVLFPKDSVVAAKLRNIVWNKMHTRENDSCDSDYHDSYLYAYRFCLHWLRLPVVPQATEEEKMERAIIKQQQLKRSADSDGF